MQLNSRKFYPISFKYVLQKLYPQRSSTVRFRLSKNRQNTPFSQQARVVQKKPYFVFRLTFSVLNIFSKKNCDVVAIYQKIMPYKFQVLTTKSDSTVIINSQVPNFRICFWRIFGNQRPYCRQPLLIHFLQYILETYRVKFPAIELHYGEEILRKY